MSYKAHLWKLYYTWQVPKRLTKNFTRPDGKPETEDLESRSRLTSHRFQVIPWLDSVRSLAGLRVLEIGCGDGQATVALAEQGAVVTGVDIEEELLNEAWKRCRSHGVTATFHRMNATEVGAQLAGNQYDMIVFYATLEHMTYAERLTAIRQTYDMLALGGLWACIGTPNRLHFYDSHTTMLPFFYWLPDELAIQYAARSPRAEYAGRFTHPLTLSDETQLEFMRWGRGMSYHELDLALGSVGSLTIVSSLMAFLKKRSLPYRTMHRFSRNGRYAAFFQRLYPQLHPCFFDSYLDFIVQK